MKELALAACFACHGAGGVSETPLTPSIAGQPAFFVVAQLFLFREGRRDAKEMTEVAKKLTDADLRSLGDALASLPPLPFPKEKPDSRKFLRGQTLAQKERCGTCHEPDFSGRENMPRLANQREDYLLKALREYKKGTRVGYGTAIMPETLSQLADGDLHHLAEQGFGGRGVAAVGGEGLDRHPRNRLDVAGIGPHAANEVGLPVTPGLGEHPLHLDSDRSDGHALFQRIVAHRMPVAERHGQLGLSRGEAEQLLQDVP